MLKSIQNKNEFSYLVLVQSIDLVCLFVVILKSTVLHLKNVLRILGIKIISHFKDFFITGTEFYWQWPTAFKFLISSFFLFLDVDEPATFEKAIEAAGFGLFNLLLLFTTMAAILSNVFSTTTMAYILPIAECDLKLSLIHKGTLNSATYAGMIASAIVWGYLADTQGRRKILIIGYLADAVCVFCSSMSQNFVMLVTFRFLGGLM